jgi:hypothetical protein
MIGRIMERCDNNNIKFELVFRKTIVAYHTDNPKANDTIMKSWFINNFGEIGRKGKNQGPFFGIKSDEISAIAIAAYGSDMEILNDKKSKTSQHPES